MGNIKMTPVVTLSSPAGERINIISTICPVCYEFFNNFSRKKPNVTIE